MERKAVLRVVVWVALAAGPAAAQIDAFDWQLAGNPAGTGSATPTNLHVIGPDSGGCTPPVTYFETVLPVGGTLSVLVDFQNLDGYYYKGQAWYDAPAWVIDGVWDMPPETGVYPPGPKGWPTGPYEFQFEAEAGQRVGLGIWSLDCFAGPGVADFHDLVLLPKPWSTHVAALDPRVLWLADLPTHEPALDVAGDVDLDGIADLVAVGSAYYFVDDLQILSGADGSVLLTLQTPLSTPTAVAGVGDVDGDGHADVAAGDPLQYGGIGLAFAGSLSVHSGADGTLLLQVSGTADWDELGDRLAGIGDVDLDGVPDLAVRLPKVFGAASQVRFLSGATGAVIETLPGPATHAFGIGLAAAGDATGDGIPDVLVGTPGGTVGVRLYSGATGQLVKTFAKPSGALEFGYSVAAAGDADGGGTVDVVVGAPSGEGRVFVFSGETTNLLATVVGEEPDGLLGGSVSGGLDVDGDGRLDVVAGAVGVQPGGSLRVFDALDGSPKAEFGGTHLQDQLGIHVRLPGDLDGDGLADVAALSAPLSTAAPATVHTWRRLDHKGPPTLAGSGEPSPLQLVTITIGNALPGAPGFLVVGGALVDQPVAGGVLAPSPDVLLPVLAGADGQASVSARWPDGLPVWTSLWMQAWMHDPAGPAGFSASDALAASQL